MKHQDDWLKRLEQRSQNVVTILVLVMAVLMIQLWLLSIALEEYMASQTALAAPTFIASCVCLLINLWLLKYLYDVDRREDTK